MCRSLPLRITAHASSCTRWLCLTAAVTLHPLSSGPSPMTSTRDTQRLTSPRKGDKQRFWIRRFRLNKNFDIIWLHVWISHLLSGCSSRSHWQPESNLTCTFPGKHTAYMTSFSLNFPWIKLQRHCVIVCFTSRVINGSPADGKNEKQQDYIPLRSQSQLRKKFILNRIEV